MAVLKPLLRKLLDKAKEMLENGECDEISPEELETIASLINKPKCLNLTEACLYLGVSRTRFYELRDSGIIEEPKCRVGSREKTYDIRKLDESKKKIS